MHTLQGEPAGGFVLTEGQFWECWRAGKAQRPAAAAGARGRGAGGGGAAQAAAGCAVTGKRRRRWRSGATRWLARPSSMAFELLCAVTYRDAGVDRGALATPLFLIWALSCPAHDRKPCAVHGEAFSASDCTPPTHSCANTALWDGERVRFAARCAKILDKRKRI